MTSAKGQVCSRHKSFASSLAFHLRLVVPLPHWQCLPSSILQVLDRCPYEHNRHGRRRSVRMPRWCNWPKVAHSVYWRCMLWGSWHCFNRELFYLIKYVSKVSNSITANLSEAAEPCKHYKIHHHPSPSTTILCCKCKIPINMLQPRCFMKSALHFCFFSSSAGFSHLFFLFLARLDNVS